MSETTTVGLGNGADTAAQTSGTAPITPTTKSRGTVTSDPKLVACIKISRTLDTLTPEDRSFVLDYVLGKYKD
jgi:hypothetical protein